MSATTTRPRCLLGIDDLTAVELHALLDLAAVMKRHPLAWHGSLQGRAVACVFERASLRTRVSLEVATHRLGGLPVVVQPHGETIPETARSLSSFCDAIAVRTGRHRELLEFAESAGVPVINERTDRENPCLALADCLHLREHFGGLSGLEIAYVGAREAGMESLIEAAMLTGMTVRVAAPPSTLPDPTLLAQAGPHVSVCPTPGDAITGADVVFSADVPRPDASTANLLPVEQAVLHALVTGDWET
jgi:ornithine carbamoyltransferase